MADLKPEARERVRALMQRMIDDGRVKNRSELARALKMAQPSVSDILNGIAGASLKTAEKVATFARVPLDSLLGLSGTEPTVEREWLHPDLPKLVAAGKMSEEEARFVNDAVRFSGGHAGQTAEQLIDAAKLAGVLLSRLAVDASDDEVPKRRRR